MTSRVRELVTELEARWVSLLTDVVRSGVEAKAFRCRDVAAAVTHIYATINGLAVAVATGSGGMTFEGAIQVCMRAAEAELDVRGRRYAS